MGLKNTLLLGNACVAVGIMYPLVDVVIPQILLWIPISSVRSTAMQLYALDALVLFQRTTTQYWYVTTHITMRMESHSRSLYNNLRLVGLSAQQHIHSVVVLRWALSWAAWH